ncbi:uncharacterized protein LOC127806052 [Diospyros lotus]|uniref:uncharacterized protein LOC127806052 n=1 Tax=Diospyros lotus TaxID=55363 RepID=UPI00225049D5|nr:uncharacterized protein LOC127806052 [Diospyros lotus]
MEKRDGTRKQEKQKIQIGGGGVVGVLLLGGVAAIATVVSVSAIGLRKRRANRSRLQPEFPEEPPPQSIPKLELNNQLLDDQGQGLLVILQDSSPPPSDYDPCTDGIKDMSVTQFDFTTLDVTKALTLDDNPMLDISGLNKKPTYLSMKGIKPTGRLLDVEITEIMAKRKIMETFQADLFGGDQGNETLLLIEERGEVVKEVVIEAAEEAVDHKAEGNPEMQLIDEEQEHDNGGKGNASEKDELQMTLTVTEDEDSDDTDVEEDEEETTEKGEGSSEGTGESSMDSGAEAIWPAESVQELSLKLRELTINNQKVEEKIGTEENGVHNNRTCTAGKSTMTRSKGHKKEILRRINLWRIWIWASWLLLLVLAAAAAFLCLPML